MVAAVVSADFPGPGVVLRDGQSGLRAQWRSLGAAGRPPGFPQASHELRVLAADNRLLLRLLCQRGDEGREASGGEETSGREYVHLLDSACQGERPDIPVLTICGRMLAMMHVRWLIGPVDEQMVRQLVRGGFRHVSLGGIPVQGRWPLAWDVSALRPKQDAAVGSGLEGPDQANTGYQRQQELVG